MTIKFKSKQNQKRFEQLKIFAKANNINFLDLLTNTPQHIPNKIKEFITLCNSKINEKISDKLFDQLF